MSRITWTSLCTHAVAQDRTPVALTGEIAVIRARVRVILNQSGRSKAVRAAPDKVHEWDWIGSMFAVSGCHQKESIPKERV